MMCDDVMGFQGGLVSCHVLDMDMGYGLWGKDEIGDGEGKFVPSRMASAIAMTPAA